MSDGPPPEGNPFGEIPFLGEFMRLFQSQAGGADTARHLARTIATEGTSEPNIDPADRIAMEELTRVAELQVGAITGLPVARGGALRVEIANRTMWADRTIEDYRPLFESLAESLTPSPPLSDDATDGDPMAQMMAGLSQMLGPLMVGMTTGSLVGNLARSALGGYTLPVPRPPDGPVLVLLPNIDRFGTEWSLDRDDLRLWVCLHEVAHHTVLGVPHVHQRLDGLLRRHAASFDRDAKGIGEALGDIDLGAGPDALAELQSMLGDPDALLGAVRSPAQEALQPELTALVATVTGYVDHVMDEAGAGLIGTYPMLTEALRRRRIEADASDRFVEKILGLELDRAQYERGSAFVEGVVERAGDEGLAQLFSDPALECSCGGPCQPGQVGQLDVDASDRFGATILPCRKGEAVGVFRGSPLRIQLYVSHRKAST